jgi:hypothetical protein
MVIQPKLKTDSPIFSPQKMNETIIQKLGPSNTDVINEFKLILSSDNPTAKLPLLPQIYQLLLKEGELIKASRQTFLENLRKQDLKSDNFLLNLKT